MAELSLNSLKNGKANTSHTHTKSDITDLSQMRSITFMFCYPVDNSVAGFFTFESGATIKGIRIKSTDALGVDKTPSASATIVILKNSVQVASTAFTVASPAIYSLSTPVSVVAGDVITAKISGTANGLVMLSVGLQYQDA